MDEVARCPHCGAINGGTAAAVDALYREVSRIKDLALALDSAQAREAELLREIRLLRETVARLRGGTRVTSS
jgi:predicted  nucleic acid-binding Zn-ribbon protein